MPRSVSRVLVPIGNEGPDRTATLALALAVGYGAELVLLKPVVVPEQTPLELPDPLLAAHRSQAGEVLSLMQDERFDVSISGAVRVGHHLDSLVATAATEHGIDLVVLDATVDVEEPGITRTSSERIARKAQCDVLVAYGPGNFDAVRSVLVSIAGGPHTRLAVDVAGALALGCDAEIEILHVISPTASDGERARGRELLDAAFSSLDGNRAQQALVEADDVASAIIDHATANDVTVLGTPRENRLQRFVFGSVTDDVRSEATTPLLVAWHHAER